MKLKRILQALSVFPFMFFHHAELSHSLEVFYDHYDFNRVHGERAIVWSEDSTYVIGEVAGRKMNYPEPVKYSSSCVEEKRPPFFLAVRVSTPEPSSANATSTEQNRKCKVTAEKIVTVHFPFNRASLTEDQRRKLIAEIETFRKEAGIIPGNNSTCEIYARVTGYACPLGSDLYNRKLSKKRAESVRSLLEKMKITVETTSPGGELRESEILCLNRKAVIHLGVREIR